MINNKQKFITDGYSIPTLGKDIDEKIVKKYNKQLSDYWKSSTGSKKLKQVKKEQLLERDNFLKSEEKRRRKARNAAILIYEKKQQKIKNKRIKKIRKQHKDISYVVKEEFLHVSELSNLIGFGIRTIYLWNTKLELNAINKGIIDIIKFKNALDTKHIRIQINKEK